MLRWIGRLLILAVIGFGIWVYGISQGWFGELHDGGQVTEGPRPPEINIVRDAQTLVAAVQRGKRDRQILFGDLHVHTTFSVDAFGGSLPVVQGEGAHPVSDACDFARFCAALDFWSITDHGLGLTQRKWTETKRVIRDCNLQAGDPKRPDMVSFLGWEWTQIGSSPDNHYGHKNVILRHTSDDLVPVRPVGAFSPKGSLAYGGWKGLPAWQPVLLSLWAPGSDRAPYYEAVLFNKELADREMCPDDVASPDIEDLNCIELAAEPKDLFRKLDEWQTEAIVIPHGTTWGYYTPPGVSLDKQLKKGQSRPDYQMLVEIFSGHGNSEEYRDWRAVRFDAAGKPSCPEPSEGYLPSCWRAGEIIAERCLAEGAAEDECATRAADARQYYVEAANVGFKVVPGERPEDWLGSGQCDDCRLPSFNYRPGNSVQYALAISNFDEAGKPKRFTWGIMASSDNHQARPGTGYKEFGRYGMTEAVSLGGLNNPLTQDKPRVAVAQPFDPLSSSLANFDLTETERQASFFMTGGLIAAHTEGRNRDAIWNAMQARKTYGTSGDRILLWFDLVEDTGVTLPMGSVVKKRSTPTFKVTALGAQKQRPGCPDYAVDQLGADEISRICMNECFNPSDERKGIERLEVIRIRPQISKGEDVAGLIEDPWKVFECDLEESRVAGCQTTFTDEDYVRGGRDATYYVRVIEEAGPTVNAGMERCTRDANGRCISVNICVGDPYAHDKGDDCLVPAEELAWSSPIFLNYE